MMKPLAQRVALITGVSSGIVSLPQRANVRELLIRPTIETAPLLPDGGSSQ
jgi:hypothetical protein